LKKVIAVKNGPEREHAFVSEEDVAIIDVDKKMMVAPNFQPLKS